MEYELRTMVPANVEYQTREESGELYIEGYFAVFNSPYVIMDGVTEIVAPGAFSDTLGEDIRALTNHDTTLILGRNKAGTLDLREDSHGLWSRIRVNQKDIDALNLYSRLSRGDVDQGSFGFYITDEERRVLDNGDVQYVIRKIRLIEVSVVTFPAYEATSVSARARQEEDIRRRAFAERKEKLRELLKGASETC